MHYEYNHRQWMLLVCLLGASLPTGTKADDSISVDQDCYQIEELITVFFENDQGSATLADWVGPMRKK